MSFVTLREILKDTRERKYAVPAFNFNGYEDAQGMISNEKCQGDAQVCASALATLRLIGMLPRPPAKCPDCNTIVITMTPRI